MGLIFISKLDAMTPTNGPEPGASYYTTDLRRLVEEDGARHFGYSQSTWTFLGQVQRAISVVALDENRRLIAGSRTALPCPPHCQGDIGGTEDRDQNNDVIYESVELQDIPQKKYNLSFLITEVTK